MGRLSLVVALLIPLVAQQPTFKSRVELVTVDAIVVDKDGRPVKGLTPDDFIVSLQGQVRPVRLLDYREYGSSPESTVPAGAAATNRAQGNVTQTRGGRIVVLVFDDLSFKPGPGKTLLAAAERSLSSFDADDLIGLTTTSGLGPVVTPTRDRGALIAALHDRKLIGRYDDSAAPFEVTEEEALQIVRNISHETFLAVLERECGSRDETTQCADQLRNAADAFGDMTLRRMAQQVTAYRQIIGTLSRTPDTPRIVVALTRGIALGLDTSDYADSLEQVSRAAADDRVQFYALSETPDLVDMSSHLNAQVLLAEGRFMNSGAQVVANAAGGESFLVTGTADRFIMRIESETSGIYRLGVEAPAGLANVRYLATTVRMREPGLTVRASRESVASGVTAAPADPDGALRTRLAEGGTSFGVPLTVGTELRREPADASRIEMDVSTDVPATVKGPLTMMYAVVDEAGKIVLAGRKQVSQEAAGDYRLAFPVPLSSGRYRLRVAAADAKADVGSIEKSVSAALTHAGSYTISDLLTTYAGVDGVPRLAPPDAIPAEARRVDLRLELYPDDRTSDAGVQVRLELLQSHKLIETRTVSPSGSGNTRVASVSLPIDALGPGPYSIRATILESGTAVGTQSTTFIKGR